MKIAEVENSVYCFDAGHKRIADMDRAELLHVIRHLLHDIDRRKESFEQMAELARLTR